MTPASYKSLLFYGPGDVRLETLPLPSPEVGEALVRIGAATTCGTDIKTFRRGHPVIIKSIPSPFGHEMAGTVVRAGPGVSAFKPGDRVAVANSAPCLECFYCKKGAPNLCENLVFLNGAFAEYIVVPAPIVRCNLHRIPDRLGFEAASLAEPLACVLHACEHVRLAAGETAAIIGTGAMAFFFVQVIRALGARSIVVGRNDTCLDSIRRYGADFSVNVKQEDPAASVRHLTDGYGADVVIEAVGQPETWQQAVGIARKGGRVGFYGGCSRGTAVNFDTYRLHYDELTISGVFHHTPEVFARAVTLLADGRIDASPFLSDIRSLRELPELFARADQPRPLKYVIRP